MAVVVTLTLTVTVQKQRMYVLVMINVYAPCQRSEPSRIHVWTVAIKIEFKKNSEWVNEPSRNIHLQKPKY
jgi:hypothetical protein